jgi:ATP-dependent metalloprotease FtsH
MRVRLFSIVALIIFLSSFSASLAQTTSQTLPTGYFTDVEIRALTHDDRFFGDSFIPWWPVLATSTPNNAWYRIDYFSKSDSQGIIRWGGRLFVNAKTGATSTEKSLYDNFGAIHYKVSTSTHILPLTTEETAVSNALTGAQLSSDYSEYRHDIWVDDDIDGTPYYRIDFIKYDPFADEIFWGNRVLVDAYMGTVVTDPSLLEKAQSNTRYIPSDFDPTTKKFRGDLEKSKRDHAILTIIAILAISILFFVAIFLYLKFRRKIVWTSVDTGFASALFLELIAAVIITVFFSGSSITGWAFYGLLGTLSSWIIAHGYMQAGVIHQELIVIKPSDLPTFSSVGGMETVKDEIRNTVGIMVNHADIAESMGVNFNGILLYGPPGTGKTFIARATAGEFNLNFLSVKVSDMTSSYQAASTQMITKIFKTAAENTPCLLFFDEFEGVVSERSSGGLSTEDVRIVNQLLRSLEEIRSLHGKVIVMAATNNKEKLDEAVVRPGRFDRQIHVPLPDVDARTLIIEHILRDKPVAKNIDATILAHISDGMSSAEIAAAIEKAIFGILTTSLADNYTETTSPIISQEQLVDAFRNLYAREKQTVKWIGWDDIILSDETVDALKKLVKFIENPDLTDRMNIDAPRGVLLFGPPGTGKTTIARVIANEANASFSSISAADIYSKWLGESEQRIQKLFSEARKHRPSIIFIDEIDAMMRTRGGGGSEHTDKITNQILQEIDGIANSAGIFIIGATNAPALIDPALLRGGRLAEKIEIPLPATREREKLFALFLRKAHQASDVNITALAACTTGFSSADIKEIVKRAIIETFEKGDEKAPVTQSELMGAIEHVMIGPESKSHPMSPYEKKLTAYHEAGHAIVAGFLPNVGPVQKITIVSRGDAGGYTLRLAEEHSYYSRNQFLDLIAVGLGGYIAEKIVFGEVTTGPSNDLEKLTKTARNMVLYYGMSEKLGAMVVNENDTNMSAQIDSEVRHIIDISYKKAEEILTKERLFLDQVATRLLGVETIERAEFESLLSTWRANKASK